MEEETTMTKVDKSVMSGEAPLIVVCFGSNPESYGVDDFHSMLPVFERHPDWKVIIGAGSLCEDLRKKKEDEFKELSNVEIESWIPLRKLIAQSALLITHGGMSSIKESILEEVPMMVIPQAWDQGGN